MQLMSRINGAYGANLPLSAIFEAPTIAELSAQVEHAGRARPAARIARAARTPFRAQPSGKAAGYGE
jgi:hypothetical protein